MSIQLCFPSLCLCEYLYAQNQLFSLCSLVFILKTKGVNSCEAKPLELYDRIMIIFAAGRRYFTVEPMCQHTGALDAPVCDQHQSDGNPTFDVSARLQVGLMPLCCVADF